MEVHAHSHTPRKKWTHYLFEFLMLFLAVFCGFLAENQRDHYVEHQREKQYIRSMIEDLETDSTNTNKMLWTFKFIQRNCDSLLDDFGSTVKFYTVKSSRLFYRIINGYPDFIYSDRTMQQLKNAGGLRLIRNKKAADSIIYYDALVRDIIREEETIDTYWSKLNEFANNFLSYRSFNEARKTKTNEELEKEKLNFWIITDLKETDRLYNLVRYYNSLIRNYVQQLSGLKNNGTRLISLLNEQYYMK